MEEKCNMNSEWKAESSLACTQNGNGIKAEK